jgi:hypothetical protein
MVFLRDRMSVFANSLSDYATPFFLGEYRVAGRASSGEVLTLANAGSDALVRLA